MLEAQLAKQRLCPRLLNYIKYAVCKMCPRLRACMCHLRIYIYRSEERPGDLHRPALDEPLIVFVRLFPLVVLGLISPRLAQRER